MVKNELMINDWYNLYANGEYSHFRVDQNTFLLDDSTICNFKPISLTTDILLQNGFKNDGDDKYYIEQHYGDGTINVTIIDEGAGEFTVRITNYDRLYHSEKRIVIESEFIKVHQLQHLLRDCNINIDLNLKIDGKY